MIMPRGAGQLLLPVNPVFLWFSLLLAMALNLMPLGRYAAMPDFIALVLVFWNVHQPRRVGIGWAFVFGLLMDVHEGALLGQHALSYSLLSYFAIALHRRVLGFGWGAQLLHVLPLFFIAQLVSLLIRLLAGDAFPGWQLALAPLIQALLWPVASWVLLAPQRRPPDPDKTRPL
ncbi:rod shape-determining protein MreD [Ideonella azotifigens]|uniref:Rod shape-determining protein MreD n=2 Tax=Ideonella azotifigens TaxID=513160 RepID=A0ABN1JMH4_9BURK|nr:rod shape-determining protein MreD [Ideonella azotifigens]MCD2339830.1 rod shape-determining protein MreD [Ideonella azotifigens]